MSEKMKGLIINGFVSKNGEKIFGCSKCSVRKARIKQHIDDYRNESDFVSIHSPPQCPRASDGCKYNVFASPEYLAVDKAFAKEYNDKNKWLQEFHDEFQKSSPSKRKIIVEKHFQKIAQRINLGFDAQDGVDGFFFGLSWDAQTPTGGSFLEIAKSLVLSEVIAYKSLMEY